MYRPPLGDYGGGRRRPGAGTLPPDSGFSDFSSSFKSRGPFSKRSGTINSIGNMKREAAVVQAGMKALSPSPPINPINMDIQTPPPTSPCSGPYDTSESQKKSKDFLNPVAEPCR